MFVRWTCNRAGMDTISKGRAAEAAVLAALMHAGLPVLVPFAGAAPYDLVVDCHGHLLRIQVKTGRVRGDVIVCNTCSTDHGRGRQTYRGLADVLAVSVQSLGRVFVLPVGACPTRAMSLRLTPPRNNQRLKVRLAEDFTLERWLATLVKAA